MKAKLREALQPKGRSIPQEEYGSFRGIATTGHHLNASGLSDCQLVFSNRMPYNSAKSSSSSGDHSDDQTNSNLAVPGG
jgi:hypothetical protein